MGRKARMGRPPKPARLRKTRRLPILLTAAEYRELSEYAAERGTSAAEIVRTAIRSLLEKRKE